MTPPYPRRGSLVIELIAGLGVIGAVAAMALPLLTAVEAHRRATERRQIALVEAENILERLSLAPWDEIDGESAKSVELPPRCREALPGAELAVAVSDPTGVPPAKRIAVRIAWREGESSAVAAVRLVMWVHRRSPARDEPQPGGDSPEATP
ncbi:MAG: hypothetical protein WD066_04725 [Planctomycetaceae bacterium]